MREAEGMIRTWKMSVEEELTAEIDKQACAASVGRDARRSNHYEVQNSP